MPRDRESTNRAARVVLALALLAVTVTAAVIAVRSIGGDSQELPFIVSADERSVVLRSVDDASVVRVLASGRDARDVKRIVVSPDGKLVYFSRGWPRHCPDWDNGTEEVWVTKDHSEIVRVPSGGGEVEHVAWGQDPVIAANGDLFYLSAEGTARDVIGYPCNHDPIEFIRRLRGPDAKGPGKAVYSHNGPAPTFFPFTARPDGQALLGDHDEDDHDGEGRQVVFTIATPPFPPERNEADDPLEGGVARTTRAVKFPTGSTDDTSVVAFVGLSVVVGSVGFGEQYHAATFDPYDGEFLEKLFEIGSDTRVLPDHEGRDFLVLDQRAKTQSVRRWSREEAFVDIGKIPAGPVTWTGGLEPCPADERDEGAEKITDDCEPTPPGVPDHTLLPRASLRPSPLRDVVPRPLRTLLPNQ